MRTMNRMLRKNRLQGLLTGGILIIGSGVSFIHNHDAFRGWLFLMGGLAFIGLEIKFYFDDKKVVQVKNNS